MRPLVIGQAPGPNTDPEQPLSGRCGDRLAALCGISTPEFLLRFDRVNLLDRFPGKAGKGDAFDLDAARVHAIELMMFGHLAGRDVVMLGDNVARAFRLPAGLKPFRMIPGLAVRVFACPHPSGVNRWWNEPANEALARRFWRRLAREAARGP